MLQRSWSWRVFFMPKFGNLELFGFWFAATISRLPKEWYWQLIVFVILWGLIQWISQAARDE